MFCHVRQFVCIAHTYCQKSLTYPNLIHSNHFNQFCHKIYRHFILHIVILGHKSMILSAKDLRDFTRDGQQEMILDKN